MLYIVGSLFCLFFQKFSLHFVCYLQLQRLELKIIFTLE
jgi:hypothetical protein